MGLNGSRRFCKTWIVLRHFLGLGIPILAGEGKYGEVRLADEVQFSV